MSISSSTNPTDIEIEIAERLISDSEFRNRFIKRWAQDEIASQIRTLRKLRQMNQGQLAALSGTGQSAISRSEQADYSGWTFKTLLALAQALRARLTVAFEPIEDVVGRYAGHEATMRENVHSTDPGSLLSPIGSVTGWAHTETVEPSLP